MKNLPAMQETQVQSLGGEEPLEEGMATHSRTLAWRIPWTEVPGRATVHGGLREADTTEQLTYTHRNAVEMTSNKVKYIVSQSFSGEKNKSGKDKIIITQYTVHTNLDPAAVKRKKK